MSGSTKFQAQTKMLTHHRSVTLLSPFKLNAILALYKYINDIDNQDSPNCP